MKRKQSTTSLDVMPPRLFDEKQAATYLGVSFVYYRVADLDGWVAGLEARRVS